MIVGLNPTSKSCHRGAFLHFIQSCVGSQVDTDHADGKSHSGVFYTATPFQNKDFQVVIKAARRTVCLYIDTSLCIVSTYDHIDNSFTCYYYVCRFNLY